MNADFATPNFELNRLLEESRAYWETGGVRGAPLSLVGADLRRVNLRERVLVGAHLHNADLRGAMLDSALLIRATLDGARLADASLFRADATKVSAVGADLSDVHAPLSRWHRAVLSRARLAGGFFLDADLSRADLIGATLDNATLVRANLRGAVVLSATFDGADLSEADRSQVVADANTFEGAVGVEPSNQTSRPRELTDGAPEDPFLRTVLEMLRDAGLSIHSGFAVGPHGVAELHDQRFLAFNVTDRPEATRISRLLEQADLVVLPDGSPNFGIVERTSPLGQAAGWIRDFPRSRIGPFGGVAIARREAERLRPYQALEAHCSSDPTALSRIAAFFDSRAESMLNSSDRAVIQQLPAHLDAQMVSSAFRWMLTKRSEVGEVVRIGSDFGHDAWPDPDDAARLAARGLALERELVDHMRTG